MKIIPERQGRVRRSACAVLLCLLPLLSGALSARAAVPGGAVPSKAQQAVTQASPPRAPSPQQAPGDGPGGLRADAPGNSQADPQEHWQVQSIHELMQQDLNDAHRRAAAPERAAGSAVGLAAQGLLAPRLVALYGVGQALMAEVQVGQRAYLYVRGQAYPAGHAGDRGVYQLRGMNGACVQLERGDDRHSLCLRMLLGEVRP
ncbi:hypothetical protein [Castellaniella caeni]|uniref:hypothetical protein n=1 Tax=Castellaniella caeni TaxID=266123 RepID=UPI000836509B|nr:hypothetical protein [Castellaniella caeni]